MKLLYLFTFYVFAAVSASAQTSFIFNNIDVYPTGNANVNNIVATGGRLFFRATDNSGDGVFVSNGTFAGTTPILLSDGTRVDAPIGELKGKIIFASTNKTGNNYLYSSDGTQAGTTVITQLATNFKPQKYFSWNNKLYIFNGDKLFCTDGTAGNLTAITNSAGDTLGVARYQNALGLNNDVYFIADTANAGLWKTDGTAAGTVRVWNTGTQYSWPIDLTLTALNNEVYFFAVDTGGNYQLAKTDGTAIGSSVVHKFKRSERYSGEATPTAFKGKLYYVINKYMIGNELWSTDGSTYATAMVKDIRKGSASGLSRSVLFIYKDNLYFQATDSTNSMDIYTTDGTDTGTKKITSLVTPNQTLWIQSVIPFKDRLIFWAYDSNNTGSGIFVSDLTPSGTTKLIPPNATNGNPISGFLAKSFIFFEPDSAVYFVADYIGKGYELWSVKEVNTSSILPVDKHGDITLYPNPAHHNFTIKTTTAFKTGSVTLTDVTGRIVKTEKLYNNQQTISLQGIAPGMYMADVWLDDKRSTQKLIIE